MNDFCFFESPAANAETLLAAPIGPQIDENPFSGTVAQRAAAIPGGTVRVWVEFIAEGMTSGYCPSTGGKPKG